jgi:hypothetical protein
MLIIVHSFLMNRPPVSGGDRVSYLWVAFVERTTLKTLNEQPPVASIAGSKSIGPTSFLGNESSRLLIEINYASGLDPEIKVDMTSLSKKTGLALEQIRTAAFALQQEGFVRCDASKNLVHITTAGIQEAVRLKMPWWFRWPKQPHSFSSQQS